VAHFTALPNGRVLLSGMTLTLERLRTGTKVAVPVPVLRALLSAAIAQLPFDEDFYLKTYPDINEAYSAGRIINLHDHFIEEGYFEGRLGTNPAVNDQFYRENYPDVAKALDTGKVTSAFDHYVATGCFEGRCANEAEQERITPWLELLKSS
jgi:hypothetical protein